MWSLRILTTMMVLTTLSFRPIHSWAPSLATCFRPLASQTLSPLSPSWTVLAAKGSSTAEAEKTKTAKKASSGGKEKSGGDNKKKGKSADKDDDEGPAPAKKAAKVVLEKVEKPPMPASTVVALSSAEVQARHEKALEKLQSKDATSPLLNKADIKVVYEDEHIVVVDKPSGLLCVPNKYGHHNLAQQVMEAVGCEMGSADRMVVHRLGMDTSGLVVLAKTLDAVRGMNSIFRTRKIHRRYEALVCGHLEKDEGSIDLPLMRDYEFPPFMRISTEDHQRALIDLDAEVVGKKLLEQPKDSVTKYQVVAREEFGGQPVTRVALQSVSGRTHQLNVHLAAFGHPIVGDTTYGLNGDAAPNGGLNEAEWEAYAPNPQRASAELQQAVNAAAQGKVCVHAKSLKFRHPVTKQDVDLSTASPF